MTKILIFFIKAYQLFFSPDHGVWRRAGRGCRFFPSCSDFACQAVEKYGVFKGLWKTVKRISRCHPFFEGGYDPVVKT